MRKPGNPEACPEQESSRSKIRINELAARHKQADAYEVSKEEIKLLERRSHLRFCINHMIAEDKATTTRLEELRRQRKGARGGA